MTAPQSLSRLIFGSMRMLERDLSEEDWVDFFAHLHEHGVDTFHSSHEYESFKFFCRVLQKARAKHGLEVRHVVKMADPHFGEEGFDADRLRARVDACCAALNVERIDCIQWMWRSDLEQDRVRREKFSVAAAADIPRAMETLKSTGRVTAVGCFPYTAEFAQAVLDEAWLDHLVLYRNPLEHDYDRLLDKAIAANKGVLALRPFAAGRAFENGCHTPRSALEYCFSHPAVRAVIATISSPPHLAQLLPALQL